MKLIFYLTYSLISTIIISCNIGIKNNYSKWYSLDKKLENKIRISHYRARDIETYSIQFYKRGAFIYSIKIQNFPNKYIIDKIDSTVKGSNTVLRLITDSVENRFKCIDFTFSPTQITNNTLIPISDIEKEIFEKVVEVSEKKKFGCKLSLSEKNKFIGWILIKY